MYEPSVTAGTGHNARTGTVVLSINGGAGRTIMPDIGIGDFAEFALDFVAMTAGQESFDEPWTTPTGTVELPVGTEWELTVTAYFAGGIEAAKSEPQIITVPSSSPIPVNVLLLPIEEGEGTFSWVIGFDGNFQSAVMEIYRGDDNVIEALEDTVDLVIGGEPQNLVGSIADLAAGEYLVVFVLSNGTDTVEIWETLHIYQNMESIFDDTFTNKYFHVSLLHFILASLDDLEQMLADGITEEHFDMVGIAGIDEDNFEAVIEAFDTLLASSVPTTEAGLKALTDAALITIGADADFLDAEQYEYQTDAENAIRDLIANGTALDIVWAEDNQTVTITAGAYEVVKVFSDEIVYFPFEYIIVPTLTAGRFRATRVGQLVANANDTTMANVINAIRADADGNDCSIQFGENDEILLSGTVTFMNAQVNWGAVTLKGRITSLNVVTINMMGVTVNSQAEIINTNNDNESGTIWASSSTVTISGGAVRNTTAGGNAVYNAGSTVIISGGTIEATPTGFAVVSETGANAPTILSGNPEIIGRIRLPSGMLSVDENFAPEAGRTYTLDFASYTNDMVAVVGGAEFAENFTLHNISGVAFEASGDDLIVNLPFDYIVTGTVAAGFTAARYGMQVAASPADTDRTQFFNFINAIRANANGEDCSIQFGVNNQWLDIGSNFIRLENTGATWGHITLLGRIRAAEAVLEIENPVSVDSKADMDGDWTIDNASNNVIISSGTVSATDVAIWSTRNITISGDAVITSEIAAANGGTIAFSGNQTLNITGGTVRNTAAGGNAIRHSGNGTVNISGGTVEATATGFAVLAAAPGTSLVLSGNPAITGRIRFPAGRLSVTEDFAPQEGRTYTLDFASYTEDMVAVVGGGNPNRIANFTLLNVPNQEWGLLRSGNDLIAVSVVPYIITPGITNFTATRRGLPVTGATNAAITNVISAIRTAANGAACVIQFGDNDVLSIGDNSVRFNNTGGTWGAITLTGSITSSTMISTAGTIVLADNVSIESRGNIANNFGNANGRAINNTGTGTVTISSGTVSAFIGQAVSNTSTGLIIVSGNAVVTSANTVSDAGTIVIAESGTATEPRLIITGGTVSNSGMFNFPVAVSNSSTGVVTISGGTISATTGQAVRNTSTGAVTISGGTISTMSGAAVSDTRGTINISGGTISSMTGMAVANTLGTTTISGGTISVEGSGSPAILSVEPGGSLVFDRTPEIKGRIRAYAGALSVIPATFAPGTNVYQLDIDLPEVGLPAVVNGAAFINNFVLFGSSLGLVVNNPNLVIGTVNLAVSGTGNAYTIRRSAGGTHTSIQSVIEAIRTAANGADCSIEFVFLSIGTESASFNNIGGTWGYITLLGSITSLNIESSQGTIVVTSNVSIESRGNIINTAFNQNARTILNSGTGTVSISGGNVFANTGEAIRNTSTGLITVSGSAVVTSINTSTTAGTIVIASSGATTAERLSITGGMVSNTANNANARAVYNTSTGSVTINGGTVEATLGMAVHNNAAGAVTISGGTVQATAANGYGVWNQAAGTVTISDGTVSAVTNGRAVHNRAAGVVTITSPPAVILPEGNGTTGTIVWNP